MRHVDVDALKFFNGLSGILAVQTSEPAVRINEHLYNEKTDASTRVLGVNLALTKDEDAPLTDEELTRVVIRSESIRMCGLSKEAVTHVSPAGAFTVFALLVCVGDTERKTRDHTLWYGGVDVHHVYFEGITERDDGVWVINWGS